MPSGGEVYIGVRLDDKDIEKDSKKVSDKITSELDRISKKTGSPKVNQLAKQAQILNSQLTNNSAKQDRLLNKPWVNVEKRIATVSRKIKLANAEMAKTIKVAPGRSELKKQLYSDYSTMQKLKSGAFSDPETIRNIYESIGKTGDYSPEIMRQYNSLRKLMRQWEELVEIRDEYNRDRTEIQENIKDTPEYKKTEEYQLMKEKQAQALSDKDRVLELDDGSDAILGKIANMSKAGSTLMKLSKTLKETGAASGEAGSSLSSLGSSLGAVAASVTIFVGIMKGLKKVCDIVDAAAKKLAQVFLSLSATVLSAVGNMQKAMWNFNKSVVSGAVNGIKKLGAVFKGTGKQADSFQGKMKQGVRLLVKYVFGLRSFFYLYRKFRTQIATGFNDIVKQVPQLNASMSTLMTSLYQLRASFAAAIEPVISYVIPILVRLIAVLDRACVAIASFFATLTGRGTIYRATVANVDYAESLDKTGKSAGSASKQNDKYTTSIDELNVIDPKDSGGSGDSTVTALEDLMQAASDFAKLVKEGWNSGDMTEVGKFLGDKLAEAISKINWTNIKVKAKKMAERIATLINGFLSGEFNGKSVAAWLGNAFAEGINTAVEFVKNLISTLDAKQLAKSILDFVDESLATIDWRSIRVSFTFAARKFIDFFTELFSSPETFANAGREIGTMFRSLLTNLITVIEEFPWAEGGTAIGTGLRALFENGITGEQIGSAIAGLLNGAITGAISLLNELLQSDTNLGQEFINALSTFLENFKPEQFVELCKKVGEMFHTIVYDALVGLGENTNDLLDTAWECIKGIWEGIKTYILGPEGEEEGGSLGDALVTLLKNALTWITDHWSEIDATIQDIATVLGGEFAKIFDPKNEIWGSMGETVGNLFNSILDGIITWCETDNNLENLSVSIRDFIKGALEKIDISKLNKVISRVGELIHSIVTDPDIMTAINNALGAIDWSAIAGIVWDLFWTQLKIKFSKFASQAFDTLTFGIFSGTSSDSSEKLTPKTEDYTKAGEECGKAVVTGYSGAVQDTKYAKEIEEAGKVMGESTVAGINESTTVEAFMPAGANVSAGYSAGITAGAPIAVAAGQQLSTDVLNSLNGGLGCASPSTKTYETGINVVQGFINGIKASTPQAKTAMQDLAKAIIQAFSAGIYSQDVVNAAKFRYLAKLAIEGFARGCEECTSIATDAVRTMAKAVVAAATEDGCLKRGSASDASGSFFEIGQNIVLGLADGIRDKTSEAVRAMHDLNEALSDTSTDENEIGSPSKRYERYGKFIVEGLNIGILSGIGDSVDAVKSWSNAMQVPAIAMGTTVPAGMSYSANKASSIAGNNTTDIINNSYMNNSDVVTAINNLIGVVSNLDLSVKLDSKAIESGSRDVRQRRGATIATGGIYNYS